VLRQGKDGPYYNLQYREHGQPVCRYVPRDQVAAVEEHTANYRTFQTLVEQYAEQIITRTREERLTGPKKRRTISAADKRPKSNS
jgi:hypothetical protein